MNFIEFSKIIGITDEQLEKIHKHFGLTCVSSHKFSKSFECKKCGKCITKCTLRICGVISPEELSSISRYSNWD